MKRFTETEKWTRNPWFRKLPVRLKCFWQLLCDSCDSAGVVKMDWEMMSFQVGEDVSPADLPALEGRLIELPNGKWWIVKYIEFQHGHLSRSCKPHLQVFKSIEANSIPYPYPLENISKGIHTLEEEVQVKDKVKDKEEGCGEKPPSVAITAQQIVEAYPRRQDVHTAIQIVAQAIEKGESPETMLSGTRAIAAAVGQMPSGALNAFVPTASSFFRAKRWNDDPLTWLRQGGNKTGSTTPPTLGGRKAQSHVKV